MGLAFLFIHKNIFIIHERNAIIICSIKRYYTKTQSHQLNNHLPLTCFRLLIWDLSLRLLRDRIENQLWMKTKLDSRYTLPFYYQTSKSLVIKRFWLLGVRLLDPHYTLPVVSKYVQVLIWKEKMKKWVPLLEILHEHIKMLRLVI